MALNVSAATVSRAIASFIDAGIVREEADDRDTRRRQVRLTEQFVQDNTLDRQIIELARRHFGDSGGYWPGRSVKAGRASTKGSRNSGKASRNRSVRRLP